MTLAITPILTWLMLSAAAALLAIGVALTAWALLWDRARGRRRCPRCWYDLRGIPVPPDGPKCPECGHALRSERALFRTRRHWRAALAGAAITLAGAALAAGERVGEKGWLGAAPTWGYIAALPWMDAGGSGMKELQRRAREGEVAGWQYPLLVKACNRSLRRSSAPDAKTMDVITIVRLVLEGARDGARSRPYASWAAQPAVDNAQTITPLLPLLRSDDTGLAVAAAECVGRSRAERARTIPALLGCLATSDRTLANRFAPALEPMLYDRRQPVRFAVLLDTPNAFGRNTVPLVHEQEFLDSLGRLENGADATPIFLDGLQAGSPLVRMTSAWALGEIACERPDVQERVLALTDDVNSVVCSAALGFACRLPLTDRTVGIFRNALRSTSSVSWAALRAIASFGPDGAPFQDDVRAIMRDTAEEGDARTVVETWLRIGGDPRTALEYLTSVLTGPPRGRGDWRPNATLATIARLGLESPEVVRFAEPLLDSQDAFTRASAALAYGCTGGDERRATRAILSIRPDSDFEVSITRSMLTTLAKTGHLCVPEMSAWLESKSPGRRADAAEVLSSAGALARSTLPALRRLRRDADPTVAQAAQHALKQIEWEISYPAQAAKLRAEDRWSR